MAPEGTEACRLRARRRCSRRRRNEGERGSPCLTKRSEPCPATAERGRSSGENESENGARAGGERLRRSSGSNGHSSALRMRNESERAREDRLAGANGSEDGGGRGRALLVADQGASRLPHARHAAAELCRLATAAQRGHPRADTVRARARGWGGERGRTGPASASRPEVWPRPANAPLFLFLFF